MDLTKLKNLIAKKPSCYQDVVIDDQKLVTGTRNTCPSRWAMLGPYIKNNKVYLDVGSDLGYFSQRIAQQCPDSVVVSVEQDKTACDIQVEIMRALNLTNVLVCNACFLSDEFKRFSLAVEAVDTILFLAVLHHYEADEERKILKLCSQMIPEIIIEYVVQTGIGAWGGKAYLDFEEELKRYYDHFEIIGKNVLGPSETRVLIRGWNDKIVRESLGSNISRKVLKYANAPNHKLSYSMGKWTLYSKIKSLSKDYPKVCENFKIGVSIFNFSFFNVLWPLHDWFKKSARYAYESLLKKGVGLTDIHPPNLIFTANGLQAIDYEHKNAPFNEDQARRSIEATVNYFDKMDPNILNR